MGQLIKPRNPQINWGNPLTKGLVIHSPMFERGGVVAKELVTNLKGTLATPTWVDDLYGPALLFNGTSDVLTLNQIPVTTSTRISILAVINPSDLSAFRTIICQRNGGSCGYYFRIGTNSGDGLLHFGYTSGGLFAVYAAGPAVTINKWQVVGAQFSFTATSTVNYYMNGVKSIASVITGQAGPDNPNVPSTVGRRTDNSMQFAGRKATVFVWNRLLTDGEWAKISADPFQIYKKQQKLYFIIPSVIKTLSGVPLTGIKKIEGVPIAQVKKVAGQLNVYQ